MTIYSALRLVGLKRKPNSVLDGRLAAATSSTALVAKPMTIGLCMKFSSIKETDRILY